MSRYIDADKLKETIKNSKYCIIGIDAEMDLIDQIMDDCKDFVDVDIDNIPTADVEEVKHGKWIMEGGVQICSACHNRARVDFNYHYIASEYCSHCGAKMDKE